MSKHLKIHNSNKNSYMVCYKKKKNKIEQLCFIDWVSEHFLEDRSSNTLQATSEIIQHSKVYYQLQKKINRDQYSEPVTTRTKTYKMTSI
jgi:hypothetical protein